MKITNFSDAFLHALTLEARQSPRQRQHRNIHKNFEEPCQRLFNAIGRDSYIRPHRHFNDPKSETLIAIRGVMALVTFDEAGEIQEAIRIGHRSRDNAPAASIGVEVPSGTWHTVIAEEEGCILFEVKAGPFDSNRAKEWAIWAPPEGTAAGREYFLNLRAKLTSLPCS